jgi:hypothetical protein
MAIHPREWKTSKALRDLHEACKELSNITDDGIGLKWIGYISWMITLLIAGILASIKYITTSVYKAIRKHILPR